MVWSPASGDGPIVETFGAVELYADGGVIRVREHIIETVLYRVVPSGEGVEMRQVGTVILPKDGFDRSLIAAYRVRLGGPRH